MASWLTGMLPVKGSPRSTSMMTTNANEASSEKFFLKSSEPIEFRALSC
jgi:hypothetical protein